MLSRRPLHQRDHKFRRGVVAIVAGSKRYPGASLLTVGGARRGGAGYVAFLNTHQSITDLVIAQYPDVVPITSIVDEKVDALVVGPGATTIRTFPTSIPVVLDSGALELARSRKKGISDSHQIVVVTPHEGELTKLGYSLIADSESERALQKNRIDVAQQIADDLHVICVLKGHRTVIAAPQSDFLQTNFVQTDVSRPRKSSPTRVRTYHVDMVGGPELATAGSGDVLAGLIGSFLASWKPLNSHDALEVVSGAVHLHSQAGKHAAKNKRSVVASDILESLAYC